MEDNKLEIECKHGKGITSIVCCHQLDSEVPVGFIENSSDPNDLQAWCYACEYLFQQEEEMTPKFRTFNNAKVVCERCYEKIKQFHLFD